MKSVIAVALLLLMTLPAFAQRCTPPAGMDIRQWYSICEPALQQAFAGGAARGLSYDDFVQSMYRVYAQPVRQQSPYPVPPTGGMLCVIGQTQCFNGYLRQCQPMPTGGSWWITGSQRCR
jgi:hypothetical protein